MDVPKETFLQLALREFKRMKMLGDAAMAQVSPEQYFEVPGPGDNSIAVIVKHVGGNLVSRWTDFLIADGEKPGRNRDVEFTIGPDDTRESLTKLWNEGWATLFSALEPLGEADLERIVRVRGEPLTVLQAVGRQLTHYSYHVGQVVYVAKHHAGGNWKSLSIPLGASATFNRDPAKYVGKA